MKAHCLIFGDSRVIMTKMGWEIFYPRRISNTKVKVKVRAVDIAHFYEATLSQVA